MRLCWDDRRAPKRFTMEGDSEKFDLWWPPWRGTTQAWRACAPNQHGPGFLGLARRWHLDGPLYGVLT
jgi:hypothetical protein